MDVPVAAGHRAGHRPGEPASTASTGSEAARANATKTGWSGARYPWESALRGSEETPAFAKTGQLEIHVNADISLAVHQFWLATGDRHWLATRGWPMLRGIADYYADRATRNADGSYSIRDVIPPDEYAEGVDDSVYTNMSAARALRFARAGRPRAGPAPRTPAGPGSRAACGSCSTAAGLTCTPSTPAIPATP